MKLRIMGTPAENEKLIRALKRNPEIDIISISKPYQNRGFSKEERVYIDCKVDTTYTPAEVVDNQILVDMSDTKELHYINPEGII